LEAFWWDRVGEVVERKVKEGEVLELAKKLGTKPERLVQLSLRKLRVFSLTMVG
jgi:hypothetical protein